MSDLYLNKRPISARGWRSGETVLEFLVRRIPGRTADYWKHALDSGQISSKERLVRACDIMKSSEELVHTLWESAEPPINPNIRVIFEDDDILVLSKPAPLPMHPCGRYRFNTLSEIVAQKWPHLKLHIVHRLDVETSGVVVLAKTKEAARCLTQQFTDRVVKKVYLAWVKGVPEWDKIVCNEPVKSLKHPAGQEARTVLRLIRHCEEATLTKQSMDCHGAKAPRNDGVLIEAYPLTGRTNQIRQHLAGLGHPVEYLHAAGLEFRHPTKEIWCEFNDHWPETYPQL
jgi:RluA family pseudouridine synthase